MVSELHSYGVQAAGLTWPNYVWIGRQKLAGILAQMATLPNSAKNQ